MSWLMTSYLKFANYPKRLTHNFSYFETNRKTIYITHGIVRKTILRSYKCNDCGVVMRLIWDKDCGVRLYPQASHRVHIAKDEINIRYDAKETCDELVMHRALR